MWKDEYVGFKKTKESAFDSREGRDRLESELNLIESHGWERYILALSRIFKSIRKNMMNVDISGTATDFVSLTGEEKKDGIFSCSALNATLSIGWPFVEMLERDSSKLVRIISRNLRGLELYSRKCIISEDFDEKTVVVLISKEPMDKKDFDTIITDVKDNKSDSSLLKDYLLITIEAKLAFSLDLKNFF